MLCSDHKDDRRPRERSPARLHPSVPEQPWWATAGSAAAAPAPGLVWGPPAQASGHPRNTHLHQWPWVTLRTRLHLRLSKLAILGLIRLHQWPWVNSLYSSAPVTASLLTVLAYTNDRGLTHCTVESIAPCSGFSSAANCAALVSCKELDIQIYCISIFIEEVILCSGCIWLVLMKTIV